MVIFDQCRTEMKSIRLGLNVKIVTHFSLAFSHIFGPSTEFNMAGSGSPGVWHIEMLVNFVLFEVMVKHKKNQISDRGASTLL